MENEKRKRGGKGGMREEVVLSRGNEVRFWSQSWRQALRRRKKQTRVSNVTSMMILLLGKKRTGNEISLGVILVVSYTSQCRLHRTCCCVCACFTVSK